MKTQAEWDSYFMKRALVVAKDAMARGDVVPVGAVVVFENGIVGKGPLRLSNSRLDHAEVLALADTSSRADLWSSSITKGITLYTTLEPCIMCFGTILHCRIGRIVYALEDPYGGACGITRTKLPLRHKEHYPEIIGGILREEARQFLREYFLTTARPIWQNQENPLVKLCFSQ